jgi:hypothetical protein
MVIPKNDLSQFLNASMNPHLRSTDGKLKGRRDILHRKPLMVMKNDGFPVIHGKLLKGLINTQEVDLG